MAAPREIIDTFESILGLYFSGVRHRERAAFILGDELVEVACKLKAKEYNHRFDVNCNFFEARNAPGVLIPEDPLGRLIQENHNNRNIMQHGSAAVTVDQQLCADAILDAVRVINHCWPNASNNFMDWMKCALRVIWLYSSQGDRTKRQSFEDAMRDEAWRAEKKQPKKNEFVIMPGRRDFWQLAITNSYVQVEAILTNLGLP